jgi:hypothetical protein
MNFYLNAVDELERQPQDEPSIGRVLVVGGSPHCLALGYENGT